MTTDMGREMNLAFHGLVADAKTSYDAHLHLEGPPTVQPGGQAHSPVMWWQVPPFWQGQRSSQ